ncbi:hypothetical protein RAA17_04720 [Komagataeibacter rhaeticus]|nr:hypothetical protein [Komagataeibacter rhaeticus]
MLAVMGGFDQDGGQQYRAAAPIRPWPGRGRGFYRVGADQARQGGAQLAVARWWRHGGPWQQAFTPGARTGPSPRGRAVAGFPRGVGSARAPRHCAAGRRD